MINFYEVKNFMKSVYQHKIINQEIYAYLKTKQK